MNAIRRALCVLLLLIAAHPCFALIDVGYLTREKASEFGIQVRQRPNGDAGVLIWVEFRKKGFLEAFTYAEFQMTDAKGRHLVSTRIQPHPVVAGQPSDLLTVAFSAQPDQLQHCSILLVAYGSRLGDVGYIIRPRDFLDPIAPPK